MKLPFFHRQSSSPNEETITLKIAKMHCTSCSLLIDGELEDTAGVIRASTNYARGTSTIVYNPTLVTVPQLKKVIANVGYEAELSH